MADVKISALTNLGAAPANDDELVIVDKDGGGATGTTKKVTVSDLLTNAGTSLTVTNGSTVTEANVSQITTGSDLTLTDDVTDGHVTLDLAASITADVTGDVTGTVSDISNHAIGGLSDVNIIGTPSAGQALIWSGADWRNSAQDNTTYTVGSATNSVNSANVDINLDASVGADTTVTLIAGTNITLTDNGSNGVTIDASGGGGGATSLNGLSDVTIASVADNQMLLYNSGTSVFENVAFEIVNDTTPQLGGNLDVNNFSLRNTNTNGNITLDPEGTGTVNILGNVDASGTNPGSLSLNCEQNTHQVTLKSADHATWGANSSYSLQLPVADGTSGQVLQTNGSGVLSFATVSGGGGGAATSLDGQNVDYSVRSTPMTTAGEYEGEAVVLGSTATTAGTLYYWNGTNWAAASNNAESTASGLIGIALGSSSADGMLIQGVYYYASPPGNNGDVLYLGTSGAFTAAAPVTNGKILRVMGQRLDANRVAINPSQDFIELGTPQGNISVVGQELDFVTNDNAIDTAGEAEGTTVKISGSTGLVPGDVYYYGSSGWALANAGAEATTKGLIGVATDADSANGVLTEGVVKLSSTPLGTTPTAGDVLYLSTTNGELTVTAPSGSTEFVRVMGYYLGSDKAYFSPSQDWIDIA